MRSQSIKDVLTEVSNFYGEGSNLETKDVLMMMQIARLDQIAETLESIDRALNADTLDNIDHSLKALAGCIGSGGSFCITGDIISSDC